MKTKYAAIAALLIIACINNAKAQNSNINYFEVYTKQAYKQPNSGFTLNKDSIVARINAIPDTASTIATFVLAVNDPAQADTLFLTITDSRGQSAFNAPVKVSTVLNTPAYRVSGQTIYYTLPAAPYLKHFTATVRVRSNDGSLTPVRSFTKN